MSLFDKLVLEANALALQLEQLQRVRTLMRACQISNIRVGDRIFESQPAALMITGSVGEGMMLVLDHPTQASHDERVCRGCGCDRLHPCVTPHGPCTWRATYDDATGFCSCCDDNGPQQNFFPHTAGPRAGEGHTHG